MKKLLLTATLLLFAFSLMSSLGLANTVTLYPTDDSYVDSAFPTTNYGSLNVSKIYSAQRSYIKFDVSSCSGLNYTDINDITFYYYEASNFGSTFNFNKISTSGYGWNESTITWNNQPAVTGTHITSLQSASSIIGYEHTANITAFAKNEIANVSDILTWYGSYSIFNAFSYFTKEASNSAYIPKIIINYNGTLTCNGTLNITYLQEAHVPSYPAPLRDLRCWAKGTSSESVNYAWYRKASGEGSFSFLTSGTSSITAGTWTIVNTLSYTSVLENAQYYCVVSDTGGSKSSNIATANYILDLRHISSPLDVSIGDTQMQTLRFNNDANISLYAFGECDWKSPSNVHYFVNDTSRLYGCEYVSPASIPNGYYPIQPKMVMNETGTWNEQSCFIYSSAYSDCRVEDLGIQDFTPNQTFWDVTVAPSITSISINPLNPKLNDNVTCSVKGITNDNTSTIDLVSVWFAINGAIITSDSQSSVANNTFVNFTLNLGGLVNNGDNVSCLAQGVKISPYQEGGIAYSNNAVVRIASITTLYTSAEPTLFGDTKTLHVISEIPFISTKIYMRKPSGNETTYIDSGAGFTLTNRSIILSSGTGTTFNELGTYYYTAKVCNCPEAFMDTGSCPDELCAFAVGFPSYNYAMRWYYADSFYLLNTHTENITYGQTETISSQFSQFANIMKVVITLPDTSVKTFIKTYFNSTETSIDIASGYGKYLDQTGTYTADIYGAYGWIRENDNQTCLDFSECTYTNSSLGNTFTVTAGAGIIDNVTFSPSTLFLGQDMNLSFDVSNQTNFVCVKMYQPVGAYKAKYSSGNLSTHWVIPYTTGESGNDFITQLGEHTFDIASCKVNGTSPCLSTSTCNMIAPSNCEYCIYQYGATLSANEGGIISNVTYKKQISVGENQVVKFKVEPYTNKTWVRILSHIVGQPDVYINTTAPNTFTDWSVTLQYANITQAVCDFNNSVGGTSCGFGGITFEIGAWVNDDWVRKGSENGEYFSFDINTSLIPDQSQNQGSIDDSSFGALFGNAFGLPAWIGFMILALFISMVFSIMAVVTIGRYAPQVTPIIAIGVFVISICIFSLAGWMPLWIPIILVIICAFIVSKWVQAGLTGGV